MNSETAFIYQARVGAFGEVTFWKNSETNSYSFTFFNGAEYTPLHLSQDAAYYVWAFIGCEHPDCSLQQKVAVKGKGQWFDPSEKFSSSSKKAGRCKTTKKRPSLAKKKK